ncbi:transforming growth factor beta-1-induced transcript 1 protein-like [Carcharodon carcharias]|uniref:transforming growth factor beta-1-induced transcript 1 protein-like n=1 Tax=Carcharodon carcharias TaxID=13397 RepID=UPI001B7E8C42|nr:transforming growth factor beta-1-induced transcript 1 protein-like [Carcharodon carcharias]
MDSATICSPVLHSDGHRQSTGGSQPPPPPAYTPQQTVSAAQAAEKNRTGPVSGEKDHLYSTVCKPKASEQSPTGNSTMVGGGLSELDRLLQELNTAQFNITDEILAQFPPGKPIESRDGGKEPELEMVSTLPDEGTFRKQVPEERAALKETGSGPQPVITCSVPQTQPKTSATSATLELDKLMASLSDFQLHSQPTPQPVTQPSVTVVSPAPSSETPAPIPTGNLDNMLGMLQSNLSRQGISTVTKGSCTACRKPIVGQVVTALGQIWHPEHFVCTHCSEEIGGSNFFEKEGLPYCEKDYWLLFSPRCAYCNEPIMDKMVTALDRNWHPNHFCCAKCGRVFAEDGFHERDGKPYCRKDFYELFASRCHGCDQAILENYISALNTLWHPECFVCRDCYTPFVNGSFFEHTGQPYCEIHYHKNRGSLCSGCEKPITGRCITAMGSKFHPKHFVCAFCLRQLNKGTFKEQNDKPYCHPCFTKLFG